MYAGLWEPKDRLSTIPFVPANQLRGILICGLPLDGRSNKERLQAILLARAQGENPAIGPKPDEENRGMAPYER